MIRLTNTSRRLKVFTLAHEVYCQMRGQCSCTITPGRTPRRLAASVTVPAASESVELDDAVLRLPEVLHAIRAGDLGIVHIVADRTRPTLDHTRGDV